ncbi:HAD family hydrolase [Corynebacterium testudinoris]|uniref:Phosphatase n=1 Tax=Corynebacterium testudinoris TaxID=136857 RepID=A0A0G3H5X8_9CORY|nr:HAD family phosphatase [Corynebacterium testudinoris]AKK08774.1 hypothetical protein CTEST_06680 [Corynebacterium testudinoris]
MLKAIFWDMDGTLVDSEPLWGIATFELSERLGRRLTPELRETTVGGSVRHTIDVCAEYAGVQLSEADYVTQRRIIYDRMAELMSEQLEPNPGVQELLGQFSAAGVPMLVTTNTERELADPSIAAVGASYFTGSVAGDEVTHPKPAPEMYLEAARRVQADPADCLVFEDSYAGMTAARAAGCRVIGLADAGPDGVTLLKDVHGETTFAGVTAEKVCDWFARLPG